MPVTNDEAPLRISLPDDAFDEEALRMFKNGHFADAVRRSAQFFENEVQRMADRPDLEGKTLLEQAFSEQKPILVFGPLDTMAQKDRHQGFRSLVVGLHRAVRNVLTHDLHQRLDREEALVWLAFIHTMNQWLSTMHRADSRSEAEANGSLDELA